jgi:hypothetical protein
MKPSLRSDASLWAVAAADCSAAALAIDAGLVFDELVCPSMVARDGFSALAVELSVAWGASADGLLGTGPSRPQPGTIMAASKRRQVFRMAITRSWEIQRSRSTLQ